MALGALWFEFGMSKGRLDIMPLVYFGLGVWLRQGGNPTPAALANLIAGLLATVLLGVFAGFGISLDGAIEGGRRLLMALMFVLCAANTAVLAYMATTDPEIAAGVRGKGRPAEEETRSPPSVRPEEEPAAGTAAEPARPPAPAKALNTGEILGQLFLGFVAHLVLVVAAAVAVTIEPLLAIPLYLLGLTVLLRSALRANTRFIAVGVLIALVIVILPLVVFGACIAAMT